MAAAKGVALEDRGRTPLLPRVQAGARFVWCRPQEEGATPADLVPDVTHLEVREDERFDLNGGSRFPVPLAHSTPNPIESL